MKWRSHGLPVLVVDDNATNRKILMETLKRWGTGPVEAASGLQALEIPARGFTATAAPSA